MKRNVFDLSHYGMTVGKIGHLQTLSVIPVVAGDSMELSMSSVNRLSPLRRSLSIDAQIDTFAFYIPHRHIYGDQWTQMMEEGVDSSITLSNYTVPAADIYYLGNVRDASKTYPLWAIAGYNRIYNRYFRFLKLTEVEIPDGYTTLDGIPTGNTSLTTPLANTIDQRFFGFLCARLKTPWSTGINYNLTIADTDVPSVTELDILDLNNVRRRYKTESQREWFDIRYTDLMKGQYGSGVNIDADQRPELIMHDKAFIGGHDIDGTGDANLGTFSGKGFGRDNFVMRKKFFAEHGAIWILRLVRFPNILNDPQEPLINVSSPRYTDIMADYDTVLGQRPALGDMNDWAGEPISGSAIDIGTVPFGQEMRYHGPVIHRNYATLEGYPLMDTKALTSFVPVVYHVNSEYDDVFSTVQLGHWQSQLAIKCLVNRRYPSARECLTPGV